MAAAPSINLKASPSQIPKVPSLQDNHSPRLQDQDLAGSRIPLPLSFRAHSKVTTSRSILKNPTSKGANTFRSSKKVRFDFPDDKPSVAKVRYFVLDGPICRQDWSIEETQNCDPDNTGFRAWQELDGTCFQSRADRQPNARPTPGSGGSRTCTKCAELRLSNGDKFIPTYPDDELFPDPQDDKRARAFFFGLWIDACQVLKELQCLNCEQCF